MNPPLLFCSLESVAPPAIRNSTISKSLATPQLLYNGNYPKLQLAPSSRGQDAEAVGATVPGGPISLRPFLTQWLMPFMPSIAVE